MKHNLNFFRNIVFSIIGIFTGMKKIGKLEFKEDINDFVCGKTN